MDPADPKPAGWYPDESNPSQQRWWNGISWGDQTRPVNPSAAPKIVPMSTPRPIVDPYAQSPSAPPRPTGPAAARGPRFSNINPVGYAGVVLAFISIVFNFFGITAALAIILSAAGLYNSRKLNASGARMTGRNWCIAGLVIGIAETAVFIASFVK